MALAESIASLDSFAKLARSTALFLAGHCRAVSILCQ